MTKKIQLKVENKKGESKDIQIEALSLSEAFENMERMNLKIKSYKYVSETSGLLKGEEPIIGNFLYYDVNGSIQIALSQPSPKTKEVIIFTRQLSVMLYSGVPLLQSISLLASQQKNRRFTLALVNIKKSIEEGKSFSSSIANFADIFSSLYISMCEAGEKTGKLDSTLAKLVTYLEKAEKIKAQVKSAMTYPTIVLVVAISVIYGLLAFVVPIFAAQFDSSGGKLPELTQMTIDLSNYLEANFSTIFSAIFISITLFILSLRFEKGREIIDTNILKLPVMGELLKKISVGRFCSTLSGMLMGGVNLLDALEICAKSAGNKFFEKFIINIKRSLEKGDKFSTPLAEGNIFPEMVISMVVVGEESGKLDEMLLKVSEFYEEEVDLAIAHMLSLIEPVMIIFIGSIVAFIVIAMYLPIFDLAGTIG